MQGIIKLGTGQTVNRGHGLHYCRSDTAKYFETTERNQNLSWLLLVTKLNEAKHMTTHLVAHTHTHKSSNRDILLIIVLW